MNAVGRFVVVAMDNVEAGEMRGDVLNVGPFDSQEAAEKWLAEDAAAALMAGGDPIIPGEQREWGAVHFVCEVKRVVRPVPEMKVEAVWADLESMTKLPSF